MLSGVYRQFTSYVCVLCGDMCAAVCSSTCELDGVQQVHGAVPPSHHLLVTIIFLTEWRVHQGDRSVLVSGITVVGNKQQLRLKDCHLHSTDTSLPPLNSIVCVLDTYSRVSDRTKRFAVFVPELIRQIFGRQCCSPAADRGAFQLSHVAECVRFNGLVPGGSFAVLVCCCCMFGHHCCLCPRSAYTHLRLLHVQVEVFSRSCVMYAGCIT
jgi:hypothetical protein